MNKSPSLKRNFIFKVFYQVTAILVPLVTTPYLARVLGAGALGDYGYTYSIMTYFGLIAVFGFNVYGRREIARTRDNTQDKSKVFWEIMFAKAIPISTAIIAYLLVSMLAFNSYYWPLLFALAPSLVYHLFDTTFLPQGEENFQTVALRDFVIKLASVVCIFVFVHSPDDVWIYALAVSGSGFLSAFFMMLYARKRIARVPVKELRVFGHLKRSARFIIPTMAASIFLYIDKIMIQLITGSSVQVAYYEEALKIIVLMSGIVTSIGNVIEPRNANELKNNNYRGAKENILSGARYSFMLAIPMMLGIIAIAPIFCPIFFGEGFEGVTPILRIMAPLFILNVMNDLLGYEFLMPAGKEKTYSIIVLISAVVNIGLNCLFIYLFGALGASIGTLVSEAVKLVLLFYVSRRELSAYQFTGGLIKKLIAAGVMFIMIFSIVYFSSNSIIVLAGTTIFGACVYASMLFMLRDEEFMSILKWGKGLFRRFIKRGKEN